MVIDLYEYIWKDTDTDTHVVCWEYVVAGHKKTYYLFKYLLLKWYDWNAIIDAVKKREVSW
jgi:hypothetical protein